MTQDVPCEVSKKKVIGLLPCNGACNVGMLTTKAVVGATKKHGNINFVCSLGIPLRIEGIVNNTRKSEYYITLNGCQVRCASKELESIDLKPDQEIVVTQDLNLQKNKNYDDDQGLEALVVNIDNLVSMI